MLDEPGHLLCRTLASSDEEISFVLSILVVHDNDKLASLEGSESSFHRREGGGSRRGGSHSRSRGGLGGVERWS